MTGKKKILTKRRKLSNKEAAAREAKLREASTRAPGGLAYKTR